MIRLVGILTGSAVAIAVLIVALGVPELESPQPEPAAEPVAVALTRPPPMAQAAPEPEPATAPAAAEPVAEPEPVAEAEPSETPAPAALMEPQSVPLEQQWYAFWSPFRSEMAADGFVSQLQRSTGLDYRVVKLKPGAYEVAFAYFDDADVQDKLSQISSATGLDLSGG